MDIWQSLTGAVIVQITSADITGMLAELHKRNIPLEHIRFLDELCCSFYVQRQYVKAIQALTEKRGETMEILGRRGIYWHIRSLRKRPILLCGIAIVVLMTVLIPMRILFFRIEGNATVPDRKILALAAQCGLDFGTSRRDIRSEKVKNMLLSSIPELEWVGINTSGCVATISVRERQTGEDEKPINGVSSIVATRDGVIREMTVTGGSSACKIGQVVKAGQTLISGYTDCGISIRAERARGEVYAETQHEFSCIMPKNSALRGKQTAVSEKISIIIGKKRINLSQDSGILDTGCVKMYEENYVTLPGGFILPITFVTETCVYYEEHTSDDASNLNSSSLPKLAESYLCSQMIAGRILSSQTDISEQEDSLLLQGKYICLEMIGQERLEEIIGP